MGSRAGGPAGEGRCQFLRAELSRKDSSVAYIHLAPTYVRAAYDAARDRRRAWQEGR